MNLPLVVRSPKRYLTIISIAIAAAVLIAASSCVVQQGPGPYRSVGTIAGTGGEFGEPFGVAYLNGQTFVSDGQNGKIWRVTNGAVSVYVDGLDTPSGIAVNAAGDLFVADAGTHTIKKIDGNGIVSNIAGVAGQSGYTDGDAASALFNAPVAVAVDADGRVFVADTYNDRVRMVDGGTVSTIAGGSRGYADAAGASAMLDTPSGIAVWHDKIVVADSGNRRIRIVEMDGRVWTLAGDGGEGSIVDGVLSRSRFAHPTAVAVGNNGLIYVADGNAVRQIGGRAFPAVETISNEKRGIRDGNAHNARFNRPSGMAVNDAGDLIVADSENRLLRQFSRSNPTHEITADEIGGLSETPEQFRNAQPPRWPYDPPDAVRDIAGTLGEIRGEIGGKTPARFHNGLDIAGNYGEVARSARDEKVLLIDAAANFNTLRELIRFPMLGYIHVSLGRGPDGTAWEDARFQFSRDPAGKLIDVRVPRGSKFKAGDAIGTLNAMNHIHLIAGRIGAEMNAIDALTLPGLSDSRTPVIENVTLFDESWRQFETTSRDSRIKLSGKVRVVMRAYDQADGNSERRRLGLYKAGYQIIGSDGSPMAEPQWTIIFDRFPPAEAVPFVYAPGSHSGATGVTIFNYIVTNSVGGDQYKESFVDTAGLEAGVYTIRVLAADYFGNTSSKDVSIEVLK